ncbi:hypothetical protein PGTUg99_016294 [Puccinia graminis f. sp. tritici]|uniref:Uncharacterized protein n=1 Tax=Puccinia graminis f. sp. tritici TaxID=56615 RepID=A0A5B0QGR0_PUCGR|nr:hypothetical protein PGTUg99_016294 [Puccinia graminis f. sp. tritici]
MVEERAQALPMSQLIAILEHMKQASIPIDGQTYVVLLKSLRLGVRSPNRSYSHYLAHLLNLQPHHQPTGSDFYTALSYEMSSRTRENAQ